jgi:hypothetical protein
MHKNVVRIVAFMVDQVLTNFTHKPQSPNYVYPHQAWAFIKPPQFIPITKHKK